MPLNGGPIFGTARDANFAARVPAETIENWNQGDVEVTDAATSYLRRGDPDAGFVYLGLVDETAHLAGSATPTYADAIATTDARIGKLLRAVRSRPTYPFESWTILVVTDHGQRPLSEPSPISHFGKTKLELTSFLVGTGPGLGKNVKKPLVVDILPTVLHQLGLATPRSWNIDGHTLSHAKPPSSAIGEAARRAAGREAEPGQPPEGARHRLPSARPRSGAATVRVNGAVGRGCDQGEERARVPCGREGCARSRSSVGDEQRRWLARRHPAGAGKMAIPLR